MTQEHLILVDLFRKQFFTKILYNIACKINLGAKWSTSVQFTFHCHKGLLVGTVPLNVTGSLINMQYVIAFADDILTLFWKFTDVKI